MQIQVNNVKTHVARGRYPQYGVGVGPVVIEQAARAVDDIGYFSNIRFKNAKGIGVGQHDPGNLTINSFPQFFQIHAAVLAGFYFNNLQAGHLSRSGISAVRGIRYNNLFTVTLAPVFVVSFNHHQAGQFTMGAGRGLQGHPGHSGEFRKTTVHMVKQFQTALNRIRALIRVNPGKSVQARHILIDLGIIFHRTGTKRVKTSVNPEVAPGQPGKMTRRLHLADLRQAGRLLSQVLGGNQAFYFLFRNIYGRQGDAGPARNALFKDKFHHNLHSITIQVLFKYSEFRSQNSEYWTTINHSFILTPDF
ncbi:MAG: hypothetical protein A4E52_00940 [Pelotomaculum sp. PtaB.Bin013]|nr:MAG: hypothetical protein A4E52_00940 [Pelotomaculum sp. PtaB.Bin013]